MNETYPNYALPVSSLLAHYNGCVLSDTKNILST